MANCFEIARDELSKVAETCGLRLVNERVKTKVAYTGTYEAHIGDVEIDEHDTCRDFITFEPTLTIRYNDSPDVQKTKKVIDAMKYALKIAVNKVDKKITQELGLARFGKPMSASDITPEKTGLMFTFSVTAEAFPLKEE